MMGGVQEFARVILMLPIALGTFACGSSTGTSPSSPQPEPAAAADPISVTRRALAGHPWKLDRAVHFDSSLHQMEAPGSADCSAEHDLQVGAVWSFHQGAAEEDSVTVQSPCETTPIAEYLTILADTGDAHLYPDAKSAYLYISVCWATADTAAPLPSSSIRGCSFGIAPNDQLVLDHYTVGFTSVDRYYFTP